MGCGLAHPRIRGPELLADRGKRGIDLGRYVGAPADGREQRDRPATLGVTEVLGQACHDLVPATQFL